MRKTITTAGGTTVSYQKYGSGPPLVLVHGAFSDDDTNWEFVKPLLQERFTVYAIARRGRGETDASQGHSLEDEGRDVLALIQAVAEPVFLLGHSYGAHCSLAAAVAAGQSVRKLVIYEAPWPNMLSREALLDLKNCAAAGAWDKLALTFFRDVLQVADEELQSLRASELWPPVVGDAQASLGDLDAFSRYHFNPENFKRLDIPVLLQIGSDSPRSLYATDALAAALPDARIEELPGQAHEGMTTAPQMYADAVIRFLLG